MYHLERSFVTTAESQMNVLEQLWADGEASAHAEQCHSALSAIKTSAMSVSARGVAVAADRCTYVLSRGMEDMLRPLATLQRLIGQYASGLREIDTEFQNPVSVAALNEAPLPEISNGQIQQQDTHLASVQQIAATNLAPLVNFAPANDQMALSKLLELSGGASVAITAPAPEKTVTLESLMSPVTNAVLGCAHRTRKSVSVSYAVDDTMICQDHALSLQNTLIDICAVLVERGQPSAQMRMQAGKGRTGQIAISVIESASGIDLVISDDGITLPASRFSTVNAASVSESRTGGTQIAVSVPYPLGPDPLSSAAQTVTVNSEANLLDGFDTDLTEALA